MALTEERQKPARRVTLSSESVTARVKPRQQVTRPPACHAGGRGFESRRSRSLPSFAYELEAGERRDAGCGRDEPTIDDGDP
jgi:hypothetical protein